MTNELGQIRCAVQIYTTRGTLSIECAPGSKNVSCHYKPLLGGDPHYNGPLDNPGQIEAALRYSCIEPTDWNVEIIEQAIRITRNMARSFNENTD